MRRRTLLGGLNTAAQLVLLAGVLALVNLLASRHFGRLDLTVDREYTLTDATVGLLGSLDDLVTVEGHFSRDLPPYLAGLRARVGDLLDEYAANSRGKLRASISSPDDDPTSAQRMRMLGIPEVQLNVVDEDRFQVTKAYLGISVRYGARNEVIPVVQGTEDLEYRLTSAILRATREKPPKVAFYAPPAMPPMMGGGGSRFSLLEEELARQYDLEPWSPGGGAVPEDAAALVVAGPRSLPDEALWRLDRFVGRGGRLLVLADAAEVGDGLQAEPIDGGLGALLGPWGLSLAGRLVADPASPSPASFSSGFVRFRVPYAWWPQVLAEGFDATHPVTSRLESLVMPWVSPVGTGEPPAGVRFTTLARSTPASWAAEPPWDLTPTNRPPVPQGDPSSHPLAVVAEGTFPTALAELPEGLDQEETTEPAGPRLPAAVLVTGTSRIADDSFLEQFPGNGVFIMNAVDWLAQSAELVGIRSRGASGRPLPEIPVATKAAVRHLNTFGPALLVLVAGLARLALRRRDTSRAV